jgi:hypothetical protein
VKSVVLIGIRFALLYQVLNLINYGDIIKQELGQEKYTEVLPYFPVCSSCGRIYTTRAYEFLPSAKKILYTCEGVTLRDRKILGCGNKGAADYTKGEGKLSWKVEFAARWDAGNGLFLVAPTGGEPTTCSSGKSACRSGCGTPVGISHFTLTSEVLPSIPGK